MQVREILTQVAQTLSENNIAEPLVEATILVAHTLKFDRTSLFLHYDKELTEVQIQSVYDLVKRRLNYEPIEYLTGKVNFMGLEFLITQPVFIPRPETEVLVETAIKLAQKIASPLQIYDIGTGCGAIGIALLKFLPTAIVYATDIIDIRLAKQNAIKHGVEGRINFIRGSLFAPFKLKADFIISNPPYIPTAQIPALQPEIRLFESHSSIDGGEDGLFYIRELIRESGKYLTPDGILLLELAPDQKEKVKEEATQYFKHVEFINDFNGDTRCLCASYSMVV